MRMGEPIPEALDGEDGQEGPGGSAVPPPPARWHYSPPTGVPPRLLCPFNPSGGGGWEETAANQVSSQARGHGASSGPGPSTPPSPRTQGQPMLPSPLREETGHPGTAPSAQQCVHRLQSRCLPAPPPPPDTCSLVGDKWPSSQALRESTLAVPGPPAVRRHPGRPPSGDWETGQWAGRDVSLSQLEFRRQRMPHRV